MFMYYFKRFLVLIALVSFCSNAFAFGSRKRKIKRKARALVSTSLEENSDAINQAGETGEVRATNTLSSDIENSVASAGSDSDLAGKLSMIAGVVAIGYGVSKIGPCVSPNLGACAQMALAFSQAGSMFGQGNSSFDTRDALSGYGGLGVYDDPAGADGYTDGIDDGGTGLGEQLADAYKSGDSEDYLSIGTLAQEQIEAGFKAIEDAGLSVNRETGEVFDANGNKINVPPNSVPSSVTRSANNALKKIKDAHEAKLLAGGFDISKGTSNAVAQGFSGLEDPFGASGYGRGPASSDDSAKKKKDFLAGLSEGANGGIGVEGDDIFKMMTRRYTKKVKSKEFIFNKNNR